MKYFIVVLVTLMFIGCSSNQDKTIYYKWVFPKVDSWKTTLDYQKQNLRLPTKADFLTKIEKEPNFFDEKFLYKVQSTSKDKLFDSKNIGQGKVFSSDNSNLYFNPKTKMIVEFGTIDTKNTKIYYLKQIDEN